MKINTQFNNRSVVIDLTKQIDISIPIDNNGGVNAFYISPAKFEPIRVGSFVGSVAEGGSANCENLFINAHGNGTHTECVGHISKERIAINDCLKEFFHFAQLISVVPENKNSDFVITLDSISSLEKNSDCEAIIIRTLPNSIDKLSKNYSGTNPCYIDAKVCKRIRELGYKHLLIDLPSVDREEDGGELSAHKEFWNFNNEPRRDMTITELIFVPSEIPDGNYFLNIQIASLMTDASPSKPLLFNMLVC